ncbi:MAG: hypothetical protein ACI97A_004165 [Planctomycetota bacterium]|jgi:hypothetical protein
MVNLVTTEFREYSTDDVFERNEAYFIDTAKSQLACPLPARLWVRTGLDYKANKENALKIGLQRAMDQFRDPVCYLVGANETPQLDNRITRYNGFWKPKRRYGWEGLSLAGGKEELHHENGGIRFFGYCRIENPMKAAFVDVLLKVGDSIIIVVLGPSRESLLDDLIGSGWAASNRSPSPSGELLSTIHKAGGIGLQLVGKFDDHESGAIVFGIS